jgi:hypothetical protein
VVSVTPRPHFTPWKRTPGTHWIGGWVGPRAGLDAEARRKILCPCRGSNPDRPARSQDIFVPELTAIGAAKYRRRVFWYHMTIFHQKGWYSIIKTVRGQHKTNRRQRVANPCYSSFWKEYSNEQAYLSNVAKKTLSGCLPGRLSKKWFSFLPLDQQ